MPIDRNVAIRAIKVWLTRNPYKERGEVAEKILLTLERLGYCKTANSKVLGK